MRVRESTVRERMEMMRRGRRGDGGGCIAWGVGAVGGCV